jgi:NADH-quinone oxidoreductase subunit H
LFETIFVDAANWLRNLLISINLSPFVVEVFLHVVKMVVILVFVLLNVMWLVYMERKVSARFQCRVGPDRNGPYGLAQIFNDVAKLISKEMILPTHVNKKMYLLAPILIFAPPMAILAVTPMGEGMAAVDLNLGLYYFVAIAGINTVVVWMAGWSSNNKYSLVGGMRAVAQMVSYEIPLLLALVGVIVLTGTLNLNGIVDAQKSAWLIFTQPLAFFIYFIAAMAEANRAPFDLVEGESEIISGPYTEYSGMGFAFFFLAEYANLLVMAIMTTTLFLGGWLAPFGWTFIPSWLWFIIKVYFVIWVVMWMRWTFPRIRIDHLMNLAWKFLVPLAIANIFVTGLAKYFIGI